MRFEATLAAPLEHVLALCSEIDLSPGWNKFVVAAAVVAREAPFRSHFYAAQWCPRPFKEFDSAVRVRGHDAYDSAVASGAVICLESWPPAPTTTKSAEGGGGGEGKEESDDDDDGENDEQKELFVPTLPAAAARRHRVLVLPGSCIVLSPITPCPATGKARTRGTLLVTMDPVLPFVPAFLVAWVLRVLAPSIKRGIDAVLAAWFADEDKEEEDKEEEKRGKGATNDRATEMRKRLRSRPELYELARELVERHAAERPGGQLPSPPERRIPRSPSRTSSGGGGGFLRWRTFSSSSSSSSGVAGTVAAAVDGAVERLSRVSAEVVERAAASAAASSAAAAAAERQHGSNEARQGEEEAQQGWISWLAWPLSAASSYVWSFFSDSAETQE